MRLLLAFVLMVLGWQLSAVAQDGPPPPQTFGPDTTRTGVFTGQGTTEPGLSCDGTAPEPRTCTGFLASAVDGTLLDVTVRVPGGTGPHPLVAVLHGWGGNKGSAGFLADPLLADGHAVLRYSARGFGESWGQVNLADVHVELEDLRSVIGQLVDDPRLQLDAHAVGITGVSYGGGQSWLALVHPFFKSPSGATVRIQTVVPIVPWTDLVYSLLPNGRPEHSLEPAGSPKLSYINALFLSGLRITQQRPYVNYPDYLVLWDAWLNLVEPNRVDPVYRQIFDGMAGYRSIWWQQDFWRDAAQNRVPVFQIQGLTDDLFPLTEAKRMLLALKALDAAYPIASYFGDVGHPRASNKDGELDYVVTLVRNWFAYYLRGLGTQPEHVVRAAITRPRDQPFNPDDVITVDSYAALATGTVARDFSATATLVNPVGDPFRGFFWDPLVMEASRELQPLPAPPEPALAGRSLAVYRVPVAELTGERPLLVAGQPTISLRALTTGPRVQLDVRLIDVAPDGAKQLITRGTFILETAPSTTDVVIPTYGNLWEAAPDHVLQLEITTLDSPYLAPSRVPSVTRISRVRLEVPMRSFPSP
jgi:pimeloyl-ACP methyl ester carboxylesterase